MSDNLKLEFLITLLKLPDRFQRVRVPRIAHDLGWTGQQHFGYQPGLDAAKAVARELAHEGVVNRWRVGIGSPHYVAVKGEDGGRQLVSDQAA